MVECAGLEIRYTVLPYRGFESLLLRQSTRPSTARGSLGLFIQGSLLMSRWLHTLRLWRGLLMLMLGAVLYLALAPNPPQSGTLGWDKLNHVLAFVALGSVARLGVVRPWPWIATALLGFGGLIELLQMLTPTRSAEWADLLADALGIAIGLMLATWWRDRAL